MQTNVNLRVMAANLTSGSYQLYESSGIRIFQGLKPDIVAIQEFNYGSKPSSTTQIRSFVDLAFGTNFSYFRETNVYENYTIPNGIISRYPILTNGSWDDGDVNITDRGFAWAQIDLPGTNDLYVISVHFKANNSSSDVNRRSNQVVVLKSLIQSHFPANAWTIVAGDMNLYAETEPAITNLKSFVSDSPVPADQNSNKNTNASRAERYDRVLPSFSMTNLFVPTVMPSYTFTSGLVFDSRVFTPLADVPPVISTDSGVNGMQHMSVVKDFRVPFSVSNFITWEAPVLTLEPPGILRWQGIGNLTYTVSASTNLRLWHDVGSASSTTSSFAFTNSIDTERALFYRVTYP